MLISEEELMRAMREVLTLDIADATPQTGFAELGMDSLSGLRFARKAQDVLGVEIELEWLLDYPSVAELARFLNARASVPAPQSAV